MPNQSNLTVLKGNHKKVILHRLKKTKADAYYRRGSFSDEIIWEGRKFRFPSGKATAKTGMWVFRSVSRDVKTYVAGKKVRELPRLPVNMWNERLRKFRGRLTATDVDHAYWRIAYMEGVITQRTYQRGLEIKDKSLRLAALANLASSKEYQLIKGGEITEETVVLKYDPVLQRIYNNIRYACYAHMAEMAKLLGDDFICYKTDCIYYRDTPENREKVHTYLDSVGLDWKQLVEPQTPVDENKSGSEGHKPRRSRKLGVKTNESDPNI